MVTVCVVGFARSPAPGPMTYRTRPTAAASVTSRTSTVVRHGGVQALRVLEMCDERWTDLDQERFQFCVRRPRNQRLVERVDDLLVICDLAIDVRFVECC